MGGQDGSVRYESKKLQDSKKCQYPRSATCAVRSFQRVGMVGEKKGSCWRGSGAGFSSRAISITSEEGLSLAQRNKTL